MIEGNRRRYQPSSRYKKGHQQGFIRKSQTFHQGHNKREYTTVIETILNDSNKENEKKEVNVMDEDKENTVSADSSKSPTINVSNDCLKEAFYFPKKLASVYKLFASSKTVNQAYQPEIARTTSMSLKAYSGDFRKDSNSECDYDGGFTSEHFISNGFHKEQYPPCLIQNQQFGMMLSAFHLQRRALEQLNHEQIQMKENTEILSMKVKVSESQFILCKIRRFDDLFMTIKIFCEINQIDSQLIRPLILEVFIALNSIYSAMNTAMTKEDLDYLSQIRSLAE